MAQELWFGGMGSVVIDEAGGDFLTPLITLDTFTEEGNTWPKPSAKETAIYGGRTAPVGEEVPVEFFAINVDPTEAATVRSRGFSLDECDVKFVSADGAVTKFLRGVIVKVGIQPLADEGKHGVVHFKMEKTNYGSTLVLEDS